MARPWTRERLLLACGVVGPPLYAGVVLALAALRPDYDHAINVMSALAARGAPNAVLMQVFGFGLLGSLSILFALGLRGSAMPGARGPGPWFLALAGVALLAVGALPCDEGCGAVSLAGKLHSPAASVAGAGMFLGLLSLGMAMANAGSAWRTHLRLTIVLGTGVAVFGALYALHAFPWQGAFQRASTGSALLWMFATAAKLLRNSPDP